MPSRAAWCRASSSGGQKSTKTRCTKRRAGRLPGGRRQGDADLRLYTRSTPTRTPSRWPQHGFKDGCRKATGSRADDGGRGRNARGLRRNVMGDLSSRRGRVQGMDDMPAAARSSRPRCRCRRCSATPRRCVRCAGRAHLHDGLQHYAEAPATSPRRSSPRAASKGQEGQARLQRARVSFDRFVRVAPAASGRR